MKIMQLIAERNRDPANHKIPTIAFLGDSVTHGVFELIPIGTERISEVFDPDAVYHRLLKQSLGKLYPAASVNIVNAGISGNSAAKGLARLERDVLSHRPDLTVVCFGLNDSQKGLNGLGDYTAAMEEIFCRILAAGGEAIFLTPNMMATEVSEKLPEGVLARIAARTAQIQNDGAMDAYMEAGRELAAKYRIPVCDVYAKWKAMQASGVNITECLANYINHPTRELHRLFADSLLETMMKNI